MKKQTKADKETKVRQDELTDVSKFLSLVLRHQPEVIDLRLDENGWADVDELLQKMSISRQSSGKSAVDRAKLNEVVRTNDKQRFAFSPDGWKIRASQGHSVQVDLKLSPHNPPQFLYHGTIDSNLHSISVNGLQKMSRNHVHLSADTDTATKVAQRYGKPKILRVKALDMKNDGFDFFKSDNGVWLTDYVPSKYVEIDWK